MDRRELLKMIGIATIISGCTKDYYKGLLTELQRDGRLRELDRVQQVIDSQYLLKTTIGYGKEDAPKERYTGQINGIGIVYGNWVLTLDHVTDKKSETIQVGPGMYIEIPLNQVSRETKLGESRLEQIVGDSEKDIAIFRLPKDFKGKKYPFELGDSDKVNYGDPILVVGNPGLEGYHIREGIVSSKPENGDFPISAGLVNGDSGTALVDRLDFKLLGLNKMMKYGRLAYVKGINDFKPYLR